MHRFKYLILICIHNDNSKAFVWQIFVYLVMSYDLWILFWLDNRTIGVGIIAYAKTIISDST